MIYCPIEFGTPEYDEAVKLRYEVLKEPLGLDFTEESLAIEFDQIHLAAFNDAGLAAYLLITPKNESVVQMRQVAVKPSLQNSGIGTGLVRYSERYSQRSGFKEIILHARENAIDFYEKLGYAKHGDSFEEVGIDHWLMKKKL